MSAQQLVSELVDMNIGERRQVAGVWVERYSDCWDVNGSWLPLVEAIKELQQRRRVPARPSPSKGQAAAQAVIDAAIAWAKSLDSPELIDFWPAPERALYRALQAYQQGRS